MPAQTGGRPPERRGERQQGRPGGEAHCGKPGHEHEQAGVKDVGDLKQVLTGTRSIRECLLKIWQPRPPGK